MLSNVASHLSLNTVDERDCVTLAKRSRLHSIRQRVLPAPTNWSTASASLAVVAFTTIVAVLIEPVANGSKLTILYVLAIFFSALNWGRRAGILSAVLGALSLSYFFITPDRSFAVSDLWHVITLFGFLTIGLIVSLVTAAVKEDAALARRREKYAAALYSFTNALASVNTLDEILETVTRYFHDIFERSVVVVARDEDGFNVYFSSPKVNLERHVISWVLESGEEAGCGSEAFRDSQLSYRPVQSGQGIIGVVGFEAESPKGPLPTEQNELLGIFLKQTALALTRADLAKKAKRAEVLQQTDKLQKALLNSVSHNLQTPLASILGVLNTILEDGALLDPVTQEGLLKTAKDEAKRLERLVKNLLDMTRLEGGAIHVRSETCDVSDIIAATLQQLGEAGHSDRISINVAPDLPLVPMDDVLIVQVLVNVLDNALKYSAPDAPIEIQAGLCEARLNIRVLDRGPGIAENELDRVFEKFFRGSAPGAPKGAGLGLSICKGLVEAHHGQIFAKRREGGGTEIALSIPLEPLHA